MWWTSAQWYFLGIAAAAAFILGIVGFRQWNASVGTWNASFLDNAYLSLELFVLGSGAVEPPIPLPLEIARFLAPVVSVYGAAAGIATLLGERISLWRLKRARRHAVICGLNQEGLLLAETLVSEATQVAFIDDAPDEWALARAKSLGITVIVGDPCDSESLRLAAVGRARVLVAICPDDGKNADIAVRASEIPRPSRAPSLAVYVHVLDTELCTLLKEHALTSETVDRVSVDFFSIPENGARAMLDTVPLRSRHEGQAPHILVVGLGKLGRSLLVQAARQYWFENTDIGSKLCVTAIDKTAESKVALLLLRYPALSESCEITALSMERESPEFEQAAYLYGSDGQRHVDAVYICPDDDVHALVSAMTLHKHTRAAGVPIAVRMSDERGLAELVKTVSGEHNLHSVGMLDQACAKDALRNSTREWIARAIHSEYVKHELMTGVSQADNPSMAPWNELPLDLKESNRCQADDIKSKIADLGMDVTPSPDWTQDAFTFSEEQVELLAQREHDRWMVERVEAGWSYAPGPKDLEKKTSPYLVPWDDLAEVDKDKDRNAMRAIPAILARAGYSVIEFDSKPVKN